MSSRMNYTALDRTLRELRGRPDELFGGVAMVLAGDFRQVLPVVRHGSEPSTINACLKHARLATTTTLMWELIEKRALTVNMRVLAQLGRTMHAPKRTLHGC